LIAAHQALVKLLFSRLKIKPDDRRAADPAGNRCRTAGDPHFGALRAAQVEMWKQKQWRSFYYWAAFTLQGE
jgi:hypothetical protein